MGAVSPGEVLQKGTAFRTILESVGPLPRRRLLLPPSPRAAVVGVTRKAGEKPKLKPAAKAVQTSAKAAPCEEGCPREAEGDAGEEGQQMSRCCVLYLE
ncbi:hypothetical protein NL676_013218 [Syzygium grande]|nr:hypothetical protein NL676_013218 [Syzygium grande]